MDKIRVGIFFGGPSREREVSFAGGRTVFDNLDKAIFEAIPIFVDSLGHFILLDWHHIYKGSIRDFYPPSAFIPPSPNQFQVYIESLGKLKDHELTSLIHQIGKPIYPGKFKDIFDFAFLALHGPYGEDGAIQGLLEWYNITYSGAGILPSAIGIDKVVQKQQLNAFQFKTPSYIIVSMENWHQNTQAIFNQIKEKIGFPCVIKAPHQGSSIGVSIVKEADLQAVQSAIRTAFFEDQIDLAAWKSWSASEKQQKVAHITDIRAGIGLPVITEEDEPIYHPEQLLKYIEQKAETRSDMLNLRIEQSENYALIESFLDGKEFSCIVIEQEDGSPLALPPTEIKKAGQFFDYRSKYLPGMSRKITPIELENKEIQRICLACESLFTAIYGQVYARIDGFYTPSGEIYLNDPNTTSGMLPSSFFFHQAAEIQLNPSQFLTYIISTSLNQRIRHGKNSSTNIKQLETIDRKLHEAKTKDAQKIKVGVIMGGFSAERHISIESGRNIYEKLASSTKYEPIPIYLTGTLDQHKLYRLPISILLKDNADDIKEKVESNHVEHEMITTIRNKAQNITEKFAGTALKKPESITYKQLAELVDRVFIAIHGRPGEDGNIQQNLEKYDVPYNGSGIASSQITINKFNTNELLQKNGINVAKHMLVSQTEWESGQAIAKIEADFSYPFIAKPDDDGCSAAVKRIEDRSELEAFGALIFRANQELPKELCVALDLMVNEEFPQKNCFLVEELIEQKDADDFMEITVGLLTHFSEETTIEYEVFSPSETIVSGEILSLEEKFLAGEGQNITPARFSKDKEKNELIEQQVKATIEQVAKLLQIEGYARIDAFVRIYGEKAETIIIEVNSLPGMTPATCIFHQTALNGYSPYQFIDKILDFGANRLHLQSQ